MIPTVPSGSFFRGGNCHRTCRLRIILHVEPAFTFSGAIVDLVVVPAIQFRSIEQP